ncbi:MAG TPA: CpsB/CapC family capsule biosynthesis tyrosine phosphatase [Tepidisphaeraceae bacterium]|jgi:protein-tyrosine phosphatase
MGRIDVHSHLLPATDDGCDTVEESLQCARMLVGAGYSHCFCTPHAWSDRRMIARNTVPAYVAELQQSLDHAAIPLRLLPGSELNLHPKVMQTPEDKIIDLCLAGRYILVDMWAEKMPDWFEPAVRWLQAMNLTVILAHPERMRAVQDQPTLARQFADMGILLQGNLQCFADRPESYTRQTAELFLTEGHYFLLGSDTHNPAGLIKRLEGLNNAIQLAGAQTIDRLTMENPAKLLPPG